MLLILIYLFAAADGDFIPRTFALRALMLLLEYGLRRDASSRLFYGHCPLMAVHRRLPPA